MVDFNPAIHTKIAHHFSYSRVGDLVDSLAILDLRVNEPYTMPKKRREIAAGQITVFVDGHAKHHTAVIEVPCWIIGTAAKERYPKWSSTDNHGGSLPAAPNDVQLRPPPANHLQHSPV